MVQNHMYSLLWKLLLGLRIRCGPESYVQSPLEASVRIED